MADASVLGIHPPSTVRIDLDGWIQDWPFEWVSIDGDRVIIAPTGRPVIHYPYEHAAERDDGWTFHGREPFTICAGPVQPAAMDTAGPAIAVT
jgi:hypothetical protein